MATNALNVGRGKLSDTAAAIDTAAVAAGKIRIIKAITLCNTAVTAQKVTISIYSNSAHHYLLYEYVMPAINGENTVTIPFLDQVLGSGDRLYGQCETANAVYYAISGKDVEI